MKDEVLPNTDEKNASNTVKQLHDELPDFNTFSKELNEKTKTFWGTVMSDYTDFANWTCLIQTVTENEVYFSLF